VHAIHIPAKNHKSQITSSKKETVFIGAWVLEFEISPPVAGWRGQRYAVQISYTTKSRRYCRDFDHNNL